MCTYSWGGGGGGGGCVVAVLGVVLGAVVSEGGAGTCDTDVGGAIVGGAVAGCRELGSVLVRWARLAESELVVAVLGGMGVLLAVDAGATADAAPGTPLVTLGGMGVRGWPWGSPRLCVGSGASVGGGAVTAGGVDSAAGYCGGIARVCGGWWRWCGEGGTVAWGGVVIGGGAVVTGGGAVVTGGGTETWAVGGLGSAGDAAAAAAVVMRIGRSTSSVVNTDGVSLFRFSPLFSVCSGMGCVYGCMGVWAG